VSGVLELHDISRAYGSAPVLDGVNLTLAVGAIGAVSGASGSGKTTLLNLVAGLDRPQQGVVKWNGQVLTGPADWQPPWQRPFAMVFQHLGLWPHLAVADHLDLVLRARGTSGRRDRRAAIDRWLQRLDIAGLADRLPGELSGGQQQRVAIARSLAANPQLLLLDEALSLLDGRTAAHVWGVIDEWRRETGATVLAVTHDAAWMKRVASPQFRLEAYKVAA
jgi:iron(III) transport system ATP-binding protein